MDEKGSNFYVTGFGSLSSFIASSSEHSSKIYKRFDKLVARDLLYYQSELAELQATQDQYDKEDSEIAGTTSAASWDVRDRCQDWKLFCSADQEKWKSRVEHAMKIRKTLKEYRKYILLKFRREIDGSAGKALVLEASLTRLGHPSKQSYEATSKVFHCGPDGAESVLIGSSSTLYPLLSNHLHPVDRDYIGFSQQHESDPLTYFLKMYCSRLFAFNDSGNCEIRPIDTMTHAVQPNIRHYSAQAIHFTVYFISTILAACLLFVPIYALFHVSRSKPKTTMGLIAMFTILFATTIALVTNARRGEIFGATAAYAAVLVVFVSGDFAANAGRSSV